MTETTQNAETTALTVSESAMEITVTDDESFSLAGDYLIRGKKAFKAAHAKLHPPVDATNKAHKAALALYHEVLDPWKAAEKHLKLQIGNYQQVIDRKADEAKRVAEEVARKQAEDERMAQAEALEKAGEKEAASAILEAPVAVPVVSVQPSVKVKGVSTREKWSAEVTSLFDLCKAIAAEQQPTSLVLPNQKSLDGMAKALKSEMRVQGVKSVKELVVAGRVG